MGEFHGNQHTESPYDDYTREELVESVRVLAEELGRAPTTGDAEADDRLPSLAVIYRIVDSGWNEVLRDAGVTPSKQQTRSASRDRTETILDDIRRTYREVEGEYLTMREYDRHGEFASSAVKERFGSWKEACTEAGVSVGTRHGVTGEGPNGERLDSRHERSAAVFLDDRGVTYEVHPPVGETGYQAEFYLPGLDLWVEVDGYVAGERPNRRTFEAKVSYFCNNDYQFVVVRTVDQLAAEVKRHLNEDS